MTPDDERIIGFYLILCPLFAFMAGMLIYGAIRKLLGKQKGWLA